MITLTEADKQEACDRANAELGSHSILRWDPNHILWDAVWRALAQACAELREKDEAAHARAVEVDRVVGEVLAANRPWFTDEKALQSLMLPDPEPDLWKELARQARDNETLKDTAARLGLKLVKDESNG